MPTTTTVTRRRNAVALVTGIANLLIGLIVLAGYAARNPSLVTFVPGSAPMRLSTAIAISSCGIAVLLLACGYRKAAAGSAAVCGAVALLDSIEAVAGAHISGFDPAMFAGGAPPRAGTLVACLLMLSAAALFLMTGLVRPRSRLAIVGVIGSILHSVGVVAAVSYLADVSSAFTAGPFSQLAIHTAIAMAALGAALMRFAWRDSVSTASGAPVWAPFLAGMGALATTFCLYGAMIADQQSHFDHEVTFEAEGLRQFMDAALYNRVQPLIRMARHRSVTPNLKKENWDADAQAVLTRGGYQAIEWIDPAGRLVWATPPGAGDATPDGNAGFEPRRIAALEAARKSRELTATRPVDLVTGGKGMIVTVPVFAENELAGYVAGVFRYELLFQNLLASNPSPRYSIAVRDSGERVFAQQSPARSANLVRAMSLAAGGSRWTLEVGPTEALVLQARSPVGGALLVAGGFLSVILTMLVYLVQKRGTRSAPYPAVGARPEPAAFDTNPAGLPVVTYSLDGRVVTWNDIAKRLFAGAPPSIPARETGFRTLYATLLKVTASPGSLDALRLLLDSCAQPALIFDAEGRFVAANTSCLETLGWSEASWSGTAFLGNEGLEFQNVLLMQGEWAVAAPSEAAPAMV